MKSTPLPFQFFLATVEIDHDYIYFLSHISKSGTENYEYSIKNS
jgi:hypothetical protein